MRSYILATLLLLTSLLSMAQTQPAKVTWKVQYRLGLNGQYNSGNVDRVLVTNKNTLNLQYGSFKAPIIYNFSYGRFKGKLNEREHFLQLNPSYEQGRVKYYYTTEAEVSNLRGIRNRVSVGVGVGYAVVAKKQVDVTISNIIFNENTNYLNQLHKHTIRSSTRLRIKTDIGNIRISSIGYYQPSLENMDNYRWSNNNSIEVKLFKPLSTAINYDQSYESFVVGNKVKYNNSLTIGFTYRFE
jgi:hypothetical protein